MGLLPELWDTDIAEHWVSAPFSSLSGRIWKTESQTTETMISQASGFEPFFSFWLVTTLRIG